MKRTTIQISFLAVIGLLISSCAPDEAEQTPVITAVVPAQGYEGDQIKIEGSNFGATMAETSVKVNGVSAELNSVATDALVIVVPLNATTGKIQVTIKGVTVTSTEDFVVISNATPKITSISPSNGKTGSTITLSGQYFTSDKSAINLLFTGANTTPAEIVSSSPTSIQAKVPIDALSGPITVTVRGVAALEKPNFEVIPNITDFTPKEGGIGNLVTISGSGFTASSSVSFSNEQGGVGIAAQVLSSNNKQLIVAVPPTTGSGKLYLAGTPTTSDFTFKSSWAIKGDFSGGYPLRVALTINSKLYFGLGYSAPSTYPKDWWEYNPQTNTWTPKANFPGTANAGTIAFSIGNKGYIGLGTTNEIWSYDPDLDKWTMVSQLQGVTSRTYAASFVIGESVYITSGTSGGTVFNDTWKYTPSTNTWDQKAAFPESGGLGYLGLSINGKGYVGHPGNPTNAFFYQYDPVLNSWSKKKDIPLHPLTSATEIYESGTPQFATSSEGIVFYDRQYFKYLPQYDSWVNMRVRGGISNDISYSLNLICGATLNGKGYYFDSSGSSRRIVEFAP
jgi:IPT/TIG domain/Kelch motif